jgi:adenylate kinase
MCAMRHPVIYLTGAPASGKSTTVRALLELAPSFVRWDYGAELLRIVSNELGRSVSYDELRADSGTLVSPRAVVTLDEHLIQWVTETRTQRPVIIDSHPVTREDYGFRVTAFSAEQWCRLAATHLFCLYCSPETTRSRIAQNAEGRLLSDEFHAGFHAALQASVAISYAIHVGAPVQLLCTDAISPASLARQISLVSGVLSQ